MTMMMMRRAPSSGDEKHGTVGVEHRNVEICLPKYPHNDALEVAQYLDW